MIPGPQPDDMPRQIDPVKLRQAIREQAAGLRIQYAVYAELSQLADDKYCEIIRDEDRIRLLLRHLGTPAADGPLNLDALTCLGENETAQAQQ